MKQFFDRNGKQKKRKERSMTARSLRSMLILGLFLILAAGLVASVQLVQRTIELHEEYVYAYISQAAWKFDGDDIIRYLETGQKDRKWEEVDTSLLLTASAGNIKYLYVVVPTEEDLIYVWDEVGILWDEDDNSSSDEENVKRITQKADFLEHAPYSEGEKDAMMKIMQLGETDDELQEKLILDTTYDKDEILGTALYPIWDDEGNVVAVIGGDISIIGLLESILRLVLNIFLAMTIVMLIGILLFFMRLRKQVIGPIVTLRRAAVGLVGNLDQDQEFKVDVHTGDEIETLARSFEEMDHHLKRYIKENLDITAERERISTELELARRIQADMLPGVFPPFPDRTEFDIYACMHPAKEIGGDFYDFFLVDENHLGLVIADVSGKGIPAALFMMMSMSMLKQYAQGGNSPKEILELANKSLCENSKEEMFVTVWLGILDIRTGYLTAANAGHEYPILKKRGGTFELYKDRHGFVVGGMEGIRYTEYGLQLEPGTVLFLYTDGLAEASDAREELFGTDRMIRALQDIPDDDPEQILDGMLRAVNTYVGDAPQFDDLTMLCLRYNGTEGS